MSTTIPTPPASAAPAAAAEPAKKSRPRSPSASGRLVSLDIFRGVTIAGMLLVNNPGSWSTIYAPLRHAPWHGWTPTDLIFPFFLFIVGVAMTFSFGHRVAEGADRHALMLKVLKRAAILFALGLLLHGFPRYDFAHMRIPGVLQRIAIAFLFASVIVIYFRLKAQVAICAALLLGYWALQTLVPGPGVWPGALLPGTDLGAFLDRAIFTEAHLWSAAKTWDPEGLLSTLPAIGTVLTGVFVGNWLHGPRSQLEKTVGLFVAGNVALFVGVCWGALFPINKSLWTSSYVLFTSGMACHFLAMCYWLADVRGWTGWGKPFVVFGTNAIAAFWLSGLGARILSLVHVGDGVTLKAWIYDGVFVPIASPMNASLLFALSYVLFWLAMMWLLYRRGIFIKV